MLQQDVKVVHILLADTFLRNAAKILALYSWTSMARTPLEPLKYVQDRGSSSY